MSNISSVCGSGCESNEKKNSLIKQNYAPKLQGVLFKNIVTDSNAEGYHVPLGEMHFSATTQQVNIALKFLFYDINSIPEKIEWERKEEYLVKTIETAFLRANETILKSNICLNHGLSHIIQVELKEFDYLELKRHKKNFEAILEHTFDKKDNTMKSHSLTPYDLCEKLKDSLNSEIQKRENFFKTLGPKELFDFKNHNNPLNQNEMSQVFNAFKEFSKTVFQEEVVIALEKIKNYKALWMSQQQQLKTLANIMLSLEVDAQKQERIIQELEKDSLSYNEINTIALEYSSRKDIDKSKRMTFIAKLKLLIYTHNELLDEVSAFQKNHIDRFAKQELNLNFDVKYPLLKKIQLNEIDFELLDGVYNALIGLIYQNYFTTLDPANAFKKSEEFNQLRERLGFQQ